MPRLLHLHLLFLIALFTTVSTVPTPCLHRPPVSLCDPSHLLSARGRSRILLAATRLTPLICTRVLIDLSPSSPSSTPVTAPSVCLLLLTGDRILVRIPHLPPTASARVTRTLRTRLRHGVPPDDAVLSALRALSVSRDASFARLMPWAALLLSAAVFAFARARARDRSALTYERWRRALKRLDDARARARASRFGDATCPICLDDFHGGATSAHDVRGGRSSGAARRTRGEADGESGSSSSGAGSCGGAAEDEVVTKRTLPCGHAFHEACLLQWLCSAARNRGACPVCRTPTGRECWRRTGMFWSGTIAAEAVSDNGAGRTEGRLRVEEDSGAGSVQDFSEGFEGGGQGTAVVDDDVGSEVTVSGVECRFGGRVV